jgi:peroxiredoxin
MKLNQGSMKKSLIIVVSALMQATFTLAGTPYKAGDVVADISLKNVNGKMISFSQFPQAKGFIVVFCCNTCPVVKKYQQRIIDLNDRFTGKGYPVIAINSNDKDVSPGDSYEAMKQLAIDKGFKYPYLYDESQETAKLWGATNTPHAYVINKKGDALILEYVGAIDNNADDPDKADKKYVEDAVNALLGNENVPVTMTRAIGCGIKWKKA